MVAERKLYSSVVPRCGLQLNQARFYWHPITYGIVVWQRLTREALH